MDTPNSRLRKARQDAGLRSARSAALRFGWKPSTYAAHENGQNDFDYGQAREYGRAFKVSVAWLAFGDETLPALRNVVSVFGRAKKGGVIEIKEGQWMEHALFSALSPTDLPENSGAIVVADDSFWPRYSESDLLVFWKGGIQKFIVKDRDESIIQSSDRRLFVKSTLFEGDGSYTLISHNAPPLRDVQISWISDIQIVLRASGWKKLTPMQARGLAIDAMNNRLSVL